MVSLVVATILAGVTDHVTSVAIPGTGPVRVLTLSSHTFKHWSQPYKAPIAGFTLEVVAAPGSDSLTLFEQTFTGDTFDPSAEPFASLARGRLTMVAAADGSAVAYSFDNERSWRLLLLSPLTSCRHRTWHNAASALAAGAESAAAATLASAHSAGTREWSDERAEQRAMMVWALRHLTPRLATAVDDYLSTTGAGVDVSAAYSNWAQELVPDFEAALPELQGALERNPALKQQVFAALEKEPSPEDRPSMLSQLAGIAPVMSGRIDRGDGGTMRLYGYLEDGGLREEPCATTAIQGDRFEFRDVDAGHYALVFSAPGYLQWKTDVKLPSHGSWRGVQRAPGVTGVIYRANGTPLKDAEVRIEAEHPLIPGEAPFAITRTDQRGIFEVPGWPTPDPQVFATPRGSTECYWWTLNGGYQKTLVLPSHRLRIRVFHHSEMSQLPSTDVEVVAWPREVPNPGAHPCVERRGITDENGWVDLEGVAERPNWTDVRVGYRGARGRADGGWVSSSGDLAVPFPPGNIKRPCCR